MNKEQALKILGLTGNPTEEQIKKAHKVKAIENHPDRGGDVAVMTQINVAKDYLLSIGSQEMEVSVRPNYNIIVVEDVSFTNIRDFFGRIRYQDNSPSEETERYKSNLQRFYQSDRKLITISNKDIKIPIGSDCSYIVYFKLSFEEKNWCFILKVIRMDPYVRDMDIMELPITSDIRKEGMSIVNKLFSSNWFGGISIPVPEKCEYCENWYRYGPDIFVRHVTMGWQEAFEKVYDSVRRI